MIQEVLKAGRQNAMTGRELAGLLNIDIRTVSAKIQQERRAGAPICATARGEKPGFYLAETAEELQGYCAALRSRARELDDTRRRLEAVIANLPGVEKADGVQLTIPGI